MPEDKKPAAPEPVKATPVVELADAAASSDAYVHQLVAARYIAAMNGDKEAADAVTAQLAELGYR